MAGAGLTHGGFYRYFKSKSDLYAAVLGCFFTDPEWKSCWEGVHVDLSSTDVGPQVARAPSIGGMVVARTTVDRALADELRADCIGVAVELGGWDKKSKSKNGKLKLSRLRRLPAS
jgi:Bacterial regulatory proteins, tetR family